ncbi:hypothetical protein GM661_07705 [Iocasia frigidifontis]|uniref:Uncharacterized protein n=1 Tax=Iocasia fonsfrigidae TaxID=2682810 RepID=A0A8A7KIB3_9FIRM|nr:hypothetical protein [Iocasia fonsfrigidae]QTL97874.1 hypothetical protein GM661_07705 [Iocasia fonsfrigidae]
MKIGPALTLKKDFDQGKNVSIKKAKKILNESKLINKLLAEPKQKPRTFVGLRAYEWRLLELSEIPYTYTLDKVKKWLNMLIEKSYIKEGFSLTGDKDGLLSCHNSMITTILIKMNYDDKDLIDAGINWIIKYQSTNRGEECEWTGKNLSDLDLIVELAKKDLFELAGLKMDLEEKLNISTDIITYSGLRNFAKKEGFKKAVLDEQVIIM